MTTTVPVLSSAEDLTEAIRYAEGHKGARWYVARKAASMGHADRVPRSWGMTAAFKGDWTPPGRETAESKGEAMEGGSFPIRDKEDLKRAVKAFGRAKDKAKAKRHILKRARALGAMDLIPDTWKKDGVKASGEPIVAARVGRKIKRVLSAFDWDPSLHPRGKDGRFIEKNGPVDVYETRGGSKASFRGKTVGLRKDEKGNAVVTVEVESPGRYEGRDVNVGDTIDVTPDRIASAPEARARVDAPGREDTGYAEVDLEERKGNVSGLINIYNREDKDDLERAEAASAVARIKQAQGDDEGAQNWRNRSNELRAQGADADADSRLDDLRSAWMAEITDADGRSIEGDELSEAARALGVELDEDQGNGLALVSLTDQDLRDLADTGYIEREQGGYRLDLDAGEAQGVLGDRLDEIDDDLAGADLPDTDTDIDADVDVDSTFGPDVDEPSTPDIGVEDEAPSGPPRPGQRVETFDNGYGVQRFNDIETGDSAFRVLDPEGNEVQRFDNLSDANAYARSRPGGAGTPGPDARTDENGEVVGVESVRVGDVVRTPGGDQGVVEFVDDNTGQVRMRRDEDGETLYPTQFDVVGRSGDAADADARDAALTAIWGDDEESRANVEDEFGKPWDELTAGEVRAKVVDQVQQGEIGDDPDSIALTREVLETLDEHFDMESWDWEGPLEQIANGPGPEETPDLSQDTMSPTDIRYGLPTEGDLREYYAKSTDPLERYYLEREADRRGVDLSREAPEGGAPGGGDVEDWSTVGQIRAGDDVNDIGYALYEGEAPRDLDEGAEVPERLAATIVDELAEYDRNGTDISADERKKSLDALEVALDMEEESWDNLDEGQFDEAEVADAQRRHDESTEKARQMLAEARGGGETPSDAGNGGGLADAILGPPGGAPDNETEARARDFADRAGVAPPPPPPGDDGGDGWSPGIMDPDESRKDLGDGLTAVVRDNDDGWSYEIVSNDIVVARETGILGPGMARSQAEARAEEYKDVIRRSGVEDDGSGIADFERARDLIRQASGDTLVSDEEGTRLADPDDSPAIRDWGDVLDVDSSLGEWASGLRDYEFDQLAEALDAGLDEDTTQLEGRFRDKYRGLLEASDTVGGDGQDPADILEFRAQMMRLGGAQEEQARSILRGEPFEDQNPNALENIADVFEAYGPRDPDFQSFTAGIREYVRQTRDFGDDLGRDGVQERRANEIDNVMREAGVNDGGALWSYATNLDGSTADQLRAVESEAYFLAEYSDGSGSPSPAQSRYLDVLRREGSTARARDAAGLEAMGDGAQFDANERAKARNLFDGGLSSEGVMRQITEDRIQTRDVQNLNDPYFQQGRQRAAVQQQPWYDPEVGRAYDEWVGAVISEMEAGQYTPEEAAEAIRAWTDEAIAARDRRDRGDNRFQVGYDAVDVVDAQAQGQMHGESDAFYGRVEIFPVGDPRSGSRFGSYEAWTVNPDGSRNGGRGNFPDRATAEAYRDAHNQAARDKAKAQADAFATDDLGAYYRSRGAERSWDKGNIDRQVELVDERIRASGYEPGEVPDYPPADRDYASWVRARSDDQRRAGMLEARDSLPDATTTPDPDPVGPRELTADKKAAADRIHTMGKSGVNKGIVGEAEAGQITAEIVNAPTHEEAQRRLAAAATRFKLGGKQRKRLRESVDQYWGVSGDDSSKVVGDETANRLRDDNPLKERLRAKVGELPREQDVDRLRDSGDMAGLKDALLAADRALEDAPVGSSERSRAVMAQSQLTKAIDYLEFFDSHPDWAQPVRTGDWSTDANSRGVFAQLHREGDSPKAYADILRRMTSNPFGYADSTRDQIEREVGRKAYNSLLKIQAAIDESGQSYDALDLVEYRRPGRSVYDVGNTSAISGTLKVPSGSEVDVDWRDVQSVMVLLTGAADEPGRIERILAKGREADADLDAGPSGAPGGGSIPLG